MSVFLTKSFARFARKSGLADEALIEAASAVASGQADADLGSGVFKQRVARAGGGKSGGYRTIILFKVGGHSFFAHGFAKNEKANISAKELKALKQLAVLYLGYSADEISAAVNGGALIEVMEDGREDEE
ncbi:type II toxin-antitoxin system RelE/ParE family toxin [Sphingomonas sp. CL5.1]|uniref:type II toxin-antitoxin system RelE/ParE family toxin n=1 Tax=Sphingomonas sp. CL5.1 TaxID=2653203 RepID=UPI0015827BBE|nr:type II toxin-antitoxin system RelE/ParE family toxin [Sphingomonas sp. CL5.1]QKS00780.1 type II toxin-antitoxin system RelE/ParE family toxin [Sphingomonas sp. CL5.1]